MFVNASTIQEEFLVRAKKKPKNLLQIKEKVLFSTKVMFLFLKYICLPIFPPIVDKFSKFLFFYLKMYRYY